MFKLQIEVFKKQEKEASTDAVKAETGVGRSNTALIALMQEELSRSQVEELRGIIRRYQSIREADTPEAERLAVFGAYRNWLIRESGIRSDGPGKVHLTLSGYSAIEFLREVQRVSKELYGKAAVYAPRLAKWEKDSEFNMVMRNQGISVNGNVLDSTGMTRQEQESRGWNNVSIRNLVLAHAAYLLLTGEDLFGGNTVRARDGIATFHSGGLDLVNYRDKFRHPTVAASMDISRRS